MKKFIRIVVTAALLTIILGISGVYAQDPVPVSIEINGKAVSFSESTPIAVNGHTLAPAQDVFNALGVNAESDRYREARGYYLHDNDDYIVIKINDHAAFINGQRKMLDVPAVVIDGIVFVPVRFIAEAFGYTVAWREADMTVLISGDTEKNAYVPEALGDDEFIAVFDVIYTRGTPPHPVIFKPGDSIRIPIPGELIHRRAFFDGWHDESTNTRYIINSDSYSNDGWDDYCDEGINLIGELFNAFDERKTVPVDSDGSERKFISGEFIEFSTDITLVLRQVFLVGYMNTPG